jgi:hypothetical protein
MRALRGYGLIALAGTLLGCGTTAPPPSAGQFNPPPAGQGLQFATKRTVKAGEEAQYCVYFQMPAGAAMNVNTIEHHYTTGSHHLLLLQTSYSPSEVALGQPFDCFGGFDRRISGVSYAAQSPDGKTTYPDGVALHFAAGEIVMVQLHLLNATPNPVDAEAKVNLWFDPKPTTAEVGTLFFYDYSIYLPPSATATAKMHCTLPKDVTLIGGYSHMHHRGIDYQALLTGDAQATPRELYATTDWENPEFKIFSPSISIKAGQAIDFRCDYRNADAVAVTDGPSAAANEMCMYIASYYPRLDAATENCLGPGSGPIQQGTHTCTDALGCVQSATDLASSRKCISNTCEKSSLALDDYLGCMAGACGKDCPGASCSACLQQNCATQSSACQAATCN